MKITSFRHAVLFNIRPVFFNKQKTLHIFYEERFWVNDGIDFEPVYSGSPKNSPSCPKLPNFGRNVIHSPLFKCWLWITELLTLKQSRFIANPGSVSGLDLR